MKPQSNITNCSESGGSFTLSLKSDIKEALNGHYASVDLAAGSDYTAVTAYTYADNLASDRSYPNLTVGCADSITAIGDCAINATVNGYTTWNTINDIVSYPSVQDFYTDSCSTSGMYIINTTDTSNPFAGCFDIIKTNRKRISLTI